MQQPRTIPQYLDYAINWILFFILWAGVITGMGFIGRGVAWLFCLGYGCTV